MQTIKYSLLFVIFLAPAGSSYAESQSSLSSALCSHLFGHEKASDEIKQLMYEAYDALGIEEKKSLPVNYIDEKKSWLQQFSAFSWFGSWFNKKAWSAFSHNEKMFAAYHEAAHHACNHPIKQLLVGFSAGLASAVVAKRLAPQLSSYAVSPKSAFHKVASGLLGVGVVCAALRMVVPRYARSCEREADKVASEALCKQGHKEVVVHHCNNLRKFQQEHGMLWFPSLAEQITTLEEIVQKQ